MTFVRYLTVGLGLLSAACVGSPVPNDKVASSEAAVQRARMGAAGAAPQAGLYLDLAGKELERGKALVRAGDYDEANAVLQRAEVDAELALAMSQENRTRTAAEETKARAQALRSRLGPPSAVGGGPITPPAEPAPQAPAAPGR
jgi:hypothetical protein